MTFVRNNRTDKNTSSAAEWHVAVYVRLSKEDGDKLESDSIQNQKNIIDSHMKHLQTQGERIASVSVYSDDGYAGGNFNRPGYQRMIRDIEAKTINCVIFKDNSRLGRNYPELGRLMEDYFPQMGVRVISVLNHIDSFKDPQSYCSAIVSFSNIMNDDYIRQLSVKIKSTFAMKRERGEFLGNYAPYGYAKSPEDRHKLVIDPEAASVVRMIFDWYTDGLSAGRIVKQLNALHIMPPSIYKTSKGCRGFTTHSSGGVKKGVWSLTTVNSILKDEVYIGNLVQGKHKSASYRTKRMIPADESEWTVVEGTHEAIISDEQFIAVHERFARHTRVSPNNRATYLLSGFVRCDHCGGRMNRYTSQGVARYRCMTRTYAPGKCSCPSVKEELLEAVLLETIQSEIQRLVDAKAVMDNMRRDRYGKADLNEYSLALNKAEQEKKRLKQAKFQLYDRLQNGIIDEMEYMDFRERYDMEINKQITHIAELHTSIQALQTASRRDDEFMAYFEKFGNIERIDRDVLDQLLDHISYSDPTHIDIYFKYSAERARILDCAQNILDTGQNDSEVC